MTPSTDIRWVQRLEHYERALRLLTEATASDPDALSDLEREGTIQRFEYTFELGWKTLKDFLEWQGLRVDPAAPRETIKAAFAAGIVANGALWLAMLERRNLLSHVYDELTFRDTVELIRGQFVAALTQACTYLEAHRPIS